MGSEQHSLHASITFSLLLSICALTQSSLHDIFVFLKLLNISCRFHAQPLELRLQSIRSLLGLDALCAFLSHHLHKSMPRSFGCAGPGSILATCGGKC
jgi:hypothetical protein